MNLNNVSIKCDKESFIDAQKYCFDNGYNWVDFENDYLYEFFSYEELITYYVEYKKLKIFYLNCKKDNFDKLKKFHISIIPRYLNIIDISRINKLKKLL